MERSEKQLPSKANFSHFFQLNCSNLRLKQCAGPYSYQNCQKIKLKEVWVVLESKKVSGDCLLNFLLLFLYLLKAKYVKKSRIYNHLQNI